MHTPDKKPDEPQLQACIDDEARLAAVRNTGLLDTPPEPVFDGLTREAASALGVPATFISLVDRTRDFYKSQHGFAEPLSAVRELEGRTFCHYTLMSESPLAIEDAARDPVYREVPTVATLGVRAYLGIPLVVDERVIGSFCAIDYEPRRWSADDIALMVALARQAMREIDTRLGASH